MSFKLNYKYYLYICYKKVINSYFKFKIANKLARKPRNFIAIYRKNL